MLKNALREKCPYLELSWSAFSRIRTEYDEILRISPYSVRVWENVDQNNSEYRHFLCSDIDPKVCNKVISAHTFYKRFSESFINL